MASSGESEAALQKMKMKASWLSSSSSAVQEVEFPAVLQRASPEEADGGVRTWP